MLMGLIRLIASMLSNIVFLSCWLAGPFTRPSRLSLGVYGDELKLAGIRYFSRVGLLGLCLEACCWNSTANVIMYACMLAWYLLVDWHRHLAMLDMLNIGTIIVS
jgi:hypothetical protein